MPSCSCTFDIDGVMAEREVLQAKIKRKEDRDRRKAAKAQAERLGLWVKGEIDYSNFYNSPCKLRVALESGDENLPVIQTSHGAHIPYKDGERCFRFAIARREKGWRRNGEQFEVGVYQLDAINEHGIVAGCHKIDWKEIERFAKQEGWAA